MAGHRRAAAGRGDGGGRAGWQRGVGSGAGARVPAAAIHRAASATRSTCGTGRCWCCPPGMSGRSCRWRCAWGWWPSRSCLRRHPRSTSRSRSARGWAGCRGRRGGRCWAALRRSCWSSGSPWEPPPSAAMAGLLEPGSGGVTAQGPEETDPPLDIGPTPGASVDPLVTLPEDGGDPLVTLPEDTSDPVVMLPEESRIPTSSPAPSSALTAGPTPTPTAGPTVAATLPPRRTPEGTVVSAAPSPTPTPTPTAMPSPTPPEPDDRTPQRRPPTARHPRPSPTPRPTLPPRRTPAPTFVPAIPSAPPTSRHVPVDFTDPDAARPPPPRRRPTPTRGSRCRRVPPRRRPPRGSRSRPPRPSRPRSRRRASP